MKLSTKINLVLGAAFLLGLLAVGISAFLLTRDNALRQITDQAELIMQQAQAVRRYTDDELRPLLDQLDDARFHPQTIPSYAATRTASLVAQEGANYSYREAVFNPTNPRDRATPDEEKIIDRFIAEPGLTRLVGSQKIDGVESLYVAYPIRVTDPGCLACHGTPEKAPDAMRAIYGDDGGFGWRLDEVVGTQMVVVPGNPASSLGQKAFFQIILSLAIVFLALLLVIHVTIRKLVLVPVNRITRMADDVSQGNLRGAELKVGGKDEIADMLIAFNRMRRSVIKIVQMMRRMQAKAKARAETKSG